MALYRQNKLWEGSRMVLPEHRTEMQEADVAYDEPHILDEQEQALLDRRLFWAWDREVRVCVHYLERGKKGWKIRKQVGKVASLNWETRQFTLCLTDGTKNHISAHLVQGIKEI